MSSGVSAFPDHARPRRSRPGNQTGRYGRRCAQGSALFANIRQHPIGDRRAGDHRIGKTSGPHRRRERKAQCVHRERPRFSRARRFPDRPRLEVSALAQERALGDWLAKGWRCIGQIAIESRDDGTFALTHRDDAARNDLSVDRELDAAVQLARFDDAGIYRPLKTAPTLRHGWKLIVENLTGLHAALDLFYPGRLAAIFAFEKGELRTTPFRETLARQSGMYRVAAQISDVQADDLIGEFCRSDGGCLRTILWRRDENGTVPSSKLAPQKFDATHDQTGMGAPVIPLLCQEPCNLLVAEARRV